MKKKDNTGGSGLLRSAMSRIDDRWIDEAASAPAAPRRGKILRAVAIAAAAAIILTSVPLGIFLSKRALTEPEPELPEYDVSRGLSVLPEALRGVTVTADGANGRIIPADSTFTVKTSGDISPEELAANLSLTPILEPVAQITELLRHEADAEYLPYRTMIRERKEELIRLIES